PDSQAARRPDGAPRRRVVGAGVVHARNRDARGARPPGDPSRLRRGRGRGVGVPDGELDRGRESRRGDASRPATDSHRARAGARPAGRARARARPRRDLAPHRAVVPDARDQGARGPFAAPEVRAGGTGEPASDAYAVAAIVYYALTGQEPDPDPAKIVPPRRLRPAVPKALERVLLRALQLQPADRYFTATEMLEDFVSDAGEFQGPAAAPQVVEAGFERRLRRALGDDYELLEEIGWGGFGRV